jgi:hypothetical protein
MKFKTIALSCLLAFVSSAYATATHHTHPQDKATTETATDKVTSGVQVKYPGYCEIEIINQSYDDIRVNGVFDDGTSLASFTVYSFEAPHYISLFYYGYCHYGMNLYIDSYYGYNLYSAYTTRESTVRIVPYLKDKAKVEVAKR